MLSKQHSYWGYLLFCFPK